jgi:hypothetical protein
MSRSHEYVITTGGPANPSGPARAELVIASPPPPAAMTSVVLALGFGAQNLVKDFLPGIFMVLEDQYGVGDVVEVDEPATLTAYTLVDGDYELVGQVTGTASITAPALSRCVRRAQRLSRQPRGGRRVRTDHEHLMAKQGLRLEFEASEIG